MRAAGVSLGCACGLIIGPPPDTLTFCALAGLLVFGAAAVACHQAAPGCQCGASRLHGQAQQARGCAGGVQVRNRYPAACPALPVCLLCAPVMPGRRA